MGHPVYQAKRRLDCGGHKTRIKQKLRPNWKHAESHKPTLKLSRNNSKISHFAIDDPVMYD